MLNCNLILNEFELQPRYYIYILTNTFGKYIPYLTSYWLNNTTAVL